MTALLVYTIGVLVFSGLYMVLSRRLWKVIIGTAFLSHAANLILLSSGGYRGEASAPILAGVEQYVDPLPQALILTAIVISFGVTAFVLIVLRQVYVKTGTTDLRELEEQEWKQDDHD
ncbi:MAG: sodium:proton antiporter [bacterium]